MHFILILLPQKIHLATASSHWCWSGEQRCRLQEKNTFFCCFLLLLFNRFSLLRLCSHNSGVWQRLMASNFVSLAKTWHFHMDLQGNIFKRERGRVGEGDKSWVCESLHPRVLPASCCKPWHSINTKCTPSVALTERKGEQSVPRLTHLFHLGLFLFLYSRKVVNSYMKIQFIPQLLKAAMCKFNDSLVKHVFAPIAPNSIILKHEWCDLFQNLSKAKTCLLTNDSFVFQSWIIFSIFIYFYPPKCWPLKYPGKPDEIWSENLSPNLIRLLHFF